MLLDDAKLALRITNNDFNDEITDLINAAEADLGLSGIDPSMVLETDPLIKRAVMIYAKANFGFDNPDADRLTQSYEVLKQHLSLSGDYNLLPDPSGNIYADPLVDWGQ
jgi:uncharacterized phage protein (predicted DNA packaging)